MKKKSTGTRREAQKQETHKIIKERAYELFEEKGYDKTTMRELASRAGVALGTIFQHFPDKPALLIAVFEEDLDVVVKKALATLPQKDLKTQLRHVVRHFFEFYAQRPELARVLLKEILFLKGQAGQTLDGLVRSFLLEVAQLFSKAIKRGELPPDLNLEHALIAFWSLYFISLLGGLRDQTFDVESQLDLFDNLLDQHLFRIGAKPD